MGSKGKGSIGTKIFKVCLALISLVLFISIIAGLVGIILYKSGEVSLKTMAKSEAPSIQNNEIEVEVVKSEQLNSTLAWQDDWVAFGSNIYQYNSDVLNFLILGIDQKNELSKTTDVSNEDAGQADSIFLISIDNKNKDINVIAIPRNSMVELEIFNNEEKKIDNFFNQICLQYAYAGGGKLGLEEMESAVSKLFYNLPIHGACALSYKALSVIVDEVGGVEIVIPDDLSMVNKDWTKGNHVMLDGSSVVKYLRYRGTEFKSSTERLTRQKAFLKEAFQKAIVTIKNKPTMVADLYEKLNPYMNTDISINQAVYIATQSLGYKIDTNNLKQLTGQDVKVEIETSYDKGYSFFDDLYLDEAELKKVMIDTFYSEVVIN